MIRQIIPTTSKERQQLILRRGPWAASTYTSTHLSRNRWRSFTTGTIPDRGEGEVEDHDLVIAGGGIVGLALASALASSRSISQSCKISLLEASDLGKVKGWKSPAPGFSNRVSSITEDNLQFLRDIGAWKYIDEDKTRTISEMQVWDGLSNARISFDASQTAPEPPITNDPASDVLSSLSHRPSMARLLENLHLQKALLRSLDESGSVDVIGGTRIEGIERDDESGWPIVRLSSGRRIRARLLVGADGFNSPVKSFAGIDSMGWSYDTHTVVGTLEFKRTNDNFTAWQRFLPTGPIAFLPLSDTRASLAWATKPHLAAALKSLEPEALSAMINAGFRLPYTSISHLCSLISSDPAPSTSTVLSEIAWRSSPSVTPPSSLPRPYEVPPEIIDVQPGTVASFPLKMSHADVYLGEPVGGRSGRTVLVGDAAHSIHPMAGQGLNLGLLDVRSLMGVVERAVEEGADIGSRTALLDYPRERWLANHTMLSAVDKLHKLYIQTSPPIVWARSTGVEVLNELDVIKGAMMGTAGANVRGRRTDGARGTTGRSVAADAVDVAMKGLDVARIVGGQVGGRLRGAVQGFLSP